MKTNTQGNMTYIKPNAGITMVKLAALMLLAMLLIPYLIEHAAGGQLTAEAATKAKTITSDIRATKYDMDLSLDDEKDRLTETVTMKIVNKSKSTVKRLCLRDMTKPLLAYAEKNHAEEGNTGKQAELKGVTLAETGEKLSTSYSKDKSSIYVEVPGGLAPGKSLSLIVETWTDIPSRQDRFSVTKTDQGKLYLLSFCFPYLADHVNGKWIEDPFFDDGESRSFSLADYNITFKAPAKYLVCATGENKTSGGVTTIKADKVRDIAICASDFMGKDTFKAGGLTVNSYYLKGKHQSAYRKVVKMVASDSIKAYTKKIGKLPSNIKELDIIHSLFGFAFGGMEFPGLIQVNGSIFYDGDSVSYSHLSLLENVSHEVGHQWFYSTVGNREYYSGWLDEGFTSYITYNLYANTGYKSVKYVMKKDKVSQSLKSFRKERASDTKEMHKVKKKNYVNVPPNKYKKGQSYGEIEYDGGESFLRELCYVMGEKRFAKFLRKYYKTYSQKTVTTRGAVAMIRKYKTPKNKKQIEQVIKKYITKKYM